MEPAWKTPRAYLLDQGFANLNSPKAVMREAYAFGILNNEEIWLLMSLMKRLLMKFFSVFRMNMFPFCKSFLRITSKTNKKSPLGVSR